jgi:hypothetical protein
MRETNANNIRWWWLGMDNGWSTTSMIRLYIDEGISTSRVGG